MRFFHFLKAMKMRTQQCAVAPVHTLYFEKCLVLFMFCLLFGCICFLRGMVVRLLGYQISYSPLQLINLTTNHFQLTILDFQIGLLERYQGWHDRRSDKYLSPKMFLDGRCCFDLNSQSLIFYLYRYSPRLNFSSSFIFNSKLNIQNQYHSCFSYLYYIGEGASNFQPDSIKYLFWRHLWIE